MCLMLTIYNYNLISFHRYSITKVETATLALCQCRFPLSLPLLNRMIKQTAILCPKKRYEAVPINTFFPQKAKPYFRIRFSGIPFAVSAAPYCFSSI